MEFHKLDKDLYVQDLKKIWENLFFPMKLTLIKIKRIIYQLALPYMSNFAIQDNLSDLET